MILDGWGLATNKEVSAIDKANTPFCGQAYIRISNTANWMLQVWQWACQKGKWEIPKWAT